MRELLQFLERDETRLGVFDFGSLFVFLTAAVLFFLTPVVGYRRDKRRFLGVSLWLFLASVALTLTQMMVVYSLIQMSKPSVRDPNMLLSLIASEEFFLGLGLIKAMLFVAAMVFFVIGLQTLQFDKNNKE